MAKKNNLEALIYSLTPIESKRFSLYTKTYTSSKSYLQLFKEIKNRTHKKPVKYSNKYAQSRKYLYRMILESLIFKNKEKFPEGEVLFYIKSARFLINKQLPDQAYNIINKAMQIVKKYEMIGFHLELIELEKEVRMYTNPKDYRSDEEIVDEEKELIIVQKHLLTMKLIYNHILTYKKKYGYIDEQLSEKLHKEVKEMGMPADVNECLTYKEKYYYYFSQSLLSRLVYKHKSAYEFSKDFLSMNIEPLSKVEFLNGLLEHSTNTICLGRSDEVLDILSFVKKSFDRGDFGSYDNIALKIFYYRSNYELLSYIFKGNRKKVEEKIVEIEKEIEYWGEKIPAEMHLILSAALKLGYIALGDLKKAGLHISKLINNYKSGLRLDAYEDGVLSHLLFVFIKNDMDYLENLSLKAYQHFIKHKNKDNIDASFKINISKLFIDYSKYKISREQLMENFKQFLEEKMKFHDNNFSETDYPYLIWINSLIEQKDFLQTASEMAKYRLISKI